MGLFFWIQARHGARDETRRNQAAAADPGVVGLGERQRRHRQDARADHARAAPAAGRHAARAHPGADLHQGRGGRDVEARVRAPGRVGDGARRQARRQARTSCSTARRRRTRCSARASCSPSPSRRQAASRCRPSTPSASGCCSAFRWRPACRRASPSSTTRSATRCCGRPIDEMLAEATARTRKSPLAPALQSAVGFATEGDFDALLGEALRERDWLTAAVRLDDDEAGGLRRRARRSTARRSGSTHGASLEDAASELDGVLSKAELTRAARCAGAGKLQRRQGAERLAAAAQGAAGRRGASRRSRMCSSPARRAAQDR